MPARYITVALHVFEMIIRLYLFWWNIYDSVLFSVNFVTPRMSDQESDECKSLFVELVLYWHCYLFVFLLFIRFLVFCFFLLFSLQTPKDSTLVFLLMYIVSSCSFTSDTIPHRSTSTSITIDSERTRMVIQPLVTTLLHTRAFTPTKSTNINLFPVSWSSFHCPFYLGQHTHYYTLNTT